MDKLGVKMLINDIENKDELFNVIVGELRGHGIKYRKEKRTKNGQDKARCKRIFNVPLHTLELTDVILANGGIAQVPLFVSDACQRILEQVHTEGLFRKAGSSKRQQEIKASLESGHPLGKSHHVIDVGNILKTFFRDLPEPLLPPGNIQEALIRCLISGEHKVYDLMITCLLLPPITLNTLAFFMQFLHTVSLNAHFNKMTMENLAIILAPNLMPIVEMVQQRLNSHVKVIQLLIEHSHQIGIVPETILEKLNDSISLIRQTGDTTGNTTDKKKKKRRSGSLTRMFHGLRKIVGAIGSSESLDKTDEYLDKDATVAATAATPCLNKSSKKRKVADGMPFSAKKKKEVVSSLPDNQEILPYTPLALMKESKKSRLSLGGNKNKMGKTGSRLAPSSSITSIVDNKPMERRWSVVGAPWARKKQNRNGGVVDSKPSSGGRIDSGRKTEEEDEGEEIKGLAGLSPVVSLPNLSTPDLEKERELFEAQIVKMPMLKGKVLFNDDDDDDDDEDEENHRKQAMNSHSGKEYMRIPKSEYEAIKERVTAIETRISQEFGNIIGGVADDKRQMLDGIERVEDKYQQTLEHTVPIEASCSSTDQLAKRLSRELKIRRSVEHKVMRSPSARKIGTIRRRSKENIRLSRNQSWHMGSTATNVKPIAPIASDLSFYPKTNLKRGRPNTVQTGLKHPELSPVKRAEDSAALSGQNITDEEKQEEKWTCAKRFFGDDLSMDTTSGDIFKTPEVTTTMPRRTSIRSAGSSKKATPHFVTRIELGEAKTPMLPPEVPPRKTPAKTPMLPPKTPGRLDSTLLKTHLTPLQELQSGRASIARLRSQNAGMVMAKAKLFDGMVTSTNQSSQPQNNRRQSSKFLMKNNPDGTKILNPLMQVPEKIQLRQVQQVRNVTSTHNVKSPHRSTPRKRAMTKSPHGGINRREKLRLAAKSPGTKAFNSPRMIRQLQDESKSLVTVNSANPDGSVCFSSNIYDLDNKTPHGKKNFARNSPRRLMATTPQGRENRSTNPVGRQQTPMKATPLSKLAIAPSAAAQGVDGMPARRESPRLLANSGPPRRAANTTAAVGP
ncbi:rho GTPase-activating protein 11A-like [Ochlerotatus camptorhynchus]|uniref:rho GTPase-activating protein 11A-like n=1 Tax=Ochlerotatus camptorhynchus TaxID=644619 RepID=UPI0031DB5839